MKNSYIKTCNYFFAIYLSIGFNYAQVPFPDLNINNITISNGNNAFINYNNIVSPSNSTNVNITNTAQVDFKAGESIILKPGFKATALSGSGYFNAKIERSDFNVVVMEPTANPVCKNEKLELGIKLPASLTSQIHDIDILNNTGTINPYDPDQISIEANFISPSGTHNRIIYGFYFHEKLELPDFSQLMPNGYNPYAGIWGDGQTDYPWRIRFAPAETGDWICNIQVIVPGQTTLYANGISFNVIGGCNNGYLEVGNDHHHLRFSESHNSFFAIGQNICWADPDWDFSSEKHPNGYYNFRENMIKKVQPNGGNYVRLIFSPTSFNSDATILGDYQDRQTHYMELDKLFETAHSDNLYLHLCMNVHYFYWTNPIVPHLSWYDNPYHTQLGLTYPTDFFTDANAKKYYKKSLRYIVSRWGYSVNLACWELFSEVDQVDNSTSNTAVRNWHVEMADYIKNVLGDKNHLMTTSYSGDQNNTGPGTFSVYGDPLFDITSKHSYIGTGVDSKDENFDHRSAEMNDLTSAFNKPGIFGEIGDDAGWAFCSDEDFHNNLWATAFMNGFGSGLAWWKWWDVSAATHRTNFACLNDFISGVDFENHTYSALHFKSRYMQSGLLWNGAVETFCLRENNDLSIIGWAHNQTYNARNPPCGSQNTELLNSEKLIFSNLPVGADYQIDWYRLYHNVHWATPLLPTLYSSVGFLGKLEIDLWDPFILDNEENGYKIYQNYTRGAWNQNDTLASDTINCYMDTLSFDGIIGNDKTGNKYRYHWSFGNGDTSIVPHPKVYYGQSGNYIVTLIYKDSSEVADTLTETITVLNCDTANSQKSLKFANNNTHNSSSSVNTFRIYPNPNTGIFRLETIKDFAGNLLIYDILGNKLMEKRINITKAEGILIDLSPVNKGIYYAKLTDDSFTSSYIKIIKN